MQVIQKFARQIKFLLHRSLISGSSDPGSGNRLRCSRSTYIKNQRNIRIIGSVSLVLLFALTAFTLRPVSVSTDFAEATANPATTTLTVETTGNAAVLDITPSSTSGTFSSSDNSGTSLAFNVSTNNITGYNLGISHGSSTTPAPLTSEDLSENLDSLPTGTSITESQFNSTEYVGYYGYKPSKLNSVSNSNYIPAPTTNSTTLNKTSRANTTSDSYTIALGANIDYTKSDGTYTNTFILTAVANNVPYRINYLDNTSDSTVTGLPTAEASSTATASGFTLSNTTPTRTNYSFIGWCDGTVTHSSTDTCTGTAYQAGSTYTFSTPSATSTNVANLYAMWKMEGYTITFKTSNASSINFNGTNYTNNQTAAIPAGTYQIYGNYATKYAFSSWLLSGSGSFGNSAYQLTTFTVSGNATITLTGQSVTTAMQDLSATSCTTTPKPVYDTRDNEVYWIQKLPDGNCWMLDNLRLGGYSSISLTSSNTNVNTTKTLPASRTTCFNDTANCDSSGYDTHTGYTVAAINAAFKNKVNTDTTENWGYGSGKYGVYYNYCAASAGTICTASNSSDASYDVCPAGWKMPLGSTAAGSYYYLYNTGYSADGDNFRTALSIPLSGYFSIDTNFGQGSSGKFWLSTRYSATEMRYMSVTSSTVYPQIWNDRYNGHSVRCILDMPTITFKTTNASSIVFNGQTYTNGQTVEVAPGTYQIYGKYATKYAFKTWAKSGSGSFGNSDYQLTTFTVSGDATITLTGQSVTTAMQGLSAASCTNTPKPVYDTRDNEVYWIQKLADGKCWMLDNLRLGGTSTINLTTSNTHSSGSYTLPASGTTCFISTANCDSSGDDTHTGYTVAAINTTSKNKVNTDTTENWGYGSGKYGVYYNFCAASAGTYCYDSNGNSSNASYDVCPAGWKMPLGSTAAGSYYYLYNTGYSADGDNFRTALSIPLSGYFVAGSSFDQDSNGYFWSSTRSSNTVMYYLNVSSSSVRPRNDSLYRYYGRFVRCILGS